MATIKKKNNRTYIDTLDTIDKACYIDIIYEGTEQELTKEISEENNMIHFICEDDESDITSVYIRSDNVVGFSVYNPDMGLPKAHVIRINPDGTVVDDPRDGERGLISSRSNKNNYRGGTLVFSKDKDGKVISEEIGIETDSNNEIIDPRKILENMNEDDVRAIETSMIDFMDKNIINIGTIVGATLKRLVAKKELNLPLEEVLNTLFSVISSLLMTKIITDNTPVDDNLDSAIEFSAMISISIVMDILNYMFYTMDEAEEIEEILSMDTENLVTWIVTHMDKI